MFRYRIALPPEKFSLIVDANRSARFAQQSFCRADGRRHGSPLPAAVQEVRRGLGRIRNGGLELVAVGERENAPPRQSRRRGRADLGADRGGRPGHDGRGRPLQRGAGRANRRHQHGLPGEEGLQHPGRSALLKDEPLVGRILKAVVRAVNVPVTLKFRTGWDPVNKNALKVAKIAEDSGVQLLSLHGRTRACGFSGRAEYDTIREVKRSTRLPVVANGDITTPEEAKHVLEYTGADGIMIGRAAQGRPWIFREIGHYLSTGEKLPHPFVSEIHSVLLAHLHTLYAFYGRETGVKVARKHISWYTKGLAGSASFRHHMNQLETCEEQLDAVNRFFEQFGRENLRLRYEVELAA